MNLLIENCSFRSDADPISYLVLCLVSEKMRQENEAVNEELGYKLFATDFILFVKLC